MNIRMRDRRGTIAREERDSRKRIIIGITEGTYMYSFRQAGMTQTSIDRQSWGRQSWCRPYK
jgi:hypothetical protein